MVELIPASSRALTAIPSTLRSYLSCKCNKFCEFLFICFNGCFIAFGNTVILPNSQMCFIVRISATSEGELVCVPVLNMVVSSQTSACPRVAAWCHHRGAGRGLWPGRMRHPCCSRCLSSVRLWPATFMCIGSLRFLPLPACSAVFLWVSPPSGAHTAAGLLLSCLLLAR